MAKFIKGQSGNLGGRPKGGRNKSSIEKGQLAADRGFPEQIELWQAMVSGDADRLAKFNMLPSEIKTKDRLEASKLLLAVVSAKNQVLGDPVSEPAKKPAEKTTPRFSQVATPIKATA